MKLRIIITSAIAVILAISCIQQKSQKVNIFICGDSTAQSYNPSKTVMRGWAQMLPEYFDKNVNIINKAKAGEAPKATLQKADGKRFLTQ